jgi:hypothetical protein
MLIFLFGLVIFEAFPDNSEHIIDIFCIAYTKSTHCA